MSKDKKKFPVRVSVLIIAAKYITMKTIILLATDQMTIGDGRVLQVMTKHGMDGNLAIAMLWTGWCVVRGIVTITMRPMIGPMIVCNTILAGHMTIARNVVCDALVLLQNKIYNIVFWISGILIMASVAIAMVRIS